MSSCNEGYRYHSDEPQPKSRPSDFGLVWFSFGGTVDVPQCADVHPSPPGPFLFDVLDRCLPVVDAVGGYANMMYMTASDECDLPLIVEVTNRRF